MKRQADINIDRPFQSPFLTLCTFTRSSIMLHLLTFRLHCASYINIIITCNFMSTCHRSYFVILYYSFSFETALRLPTFIGIWCISLSAKMLHIFVIAVIIIFIGIITCIIIITTITIVIVIKNYRKYQHRNYYHHWHYLYHEF